MHQKIPYIARLRHLEYHTEAVDLYIMMVPLQAQCRVDIYRQLIGNPVDNRFIRRTVTCGEKWVYYPNPDSSKEWLGLRQPAKYR